MNKVFITGLELSYSKPFFRSEDIIRLRALINYPKDEDAYLKELEDEYSYIDKLNDKYGQKGLDARGMARRDLDDLKRFTEGWSFTYSPERTEYYLFKEKQ